jgi:hypothetical protein
MRHDLLLKDRGLQHGFECVFREKWRQLSMSTCHQPGGEPPEARWFRRRPNDDAPRRVGSPTWVCLPEPPRQHAEAPRLFMDAVDRGLRGLEIRQTVCAIDDRVLHRDVRPRDA